jgi:hypothetical protein
MGKNDREIKLPTFVGEKVLTDICKNEHCYWHSLTMVVYVGFFNVSLIQFPITSNL